MPTGPSPFAFAEALDRDLGDPHDPDGLFSYRRAAELDRAEAFPTAPCAGLDALGLHRLYVPERFGGELTSHETLLMLARILCRRDFTTALAHTKTYLGAASTWVGGAPALAEALAAKVLAGDVVALALTEVEHGSDLLAGELTARETPTGFRVDGTKWLVNNATRGHVVCVLARTDPHGGPRGFSLLLVDKRETGGVRPVAAVRTHGVRGADISGVTFDGAQVPRTALVGQPGEGLEIVLRGMQVTRTLCGGLSLGMADHALRLAVDFATTHRLYDRRLVDLPQASRTLTTAYADLLAAEAVALVATRGLHALPGEQSVASAVVKYWVPTAVDGLITALARVLGARALLTDAHADGRFQKLQRDHQIVGIFDGSTHVNLAALINQFPALARGYRQGRVDRPGLAMAADLARPLPPFAPELLTLASRHGSSPLQALPGAVDELLDLAAAGEVGADVAELGEQVREAVDDLHVRLAAYRPTARGAPSSAYSLAARYAECWAAAAVLQLWLRNRETSDQAGDTLLAAGLARRLARLRAPGTGGSADAVDRLRVPLLHQFERGQLFSVLPCRLIGEERKPTDA